MYARPEFSFIAGDLALDFVNTTSDRKSDQPSERLRVYADLVWWSYEAGLIGGRVARMLVAASEGRADHAARVIARARALREALFNAFAVTTEGGTPRQTDLDVLNAELTSALPQLEVRPGGDCCSLQFAGAEDALDRMLWSVARASVDVLTSPRLRQVKQCAGDPCDWLFLDESRNHSRRWCDMRDCGNRAKARRHYRKKSKGKAVNTTY
jgi:predicted RNA-binding Zn ribbon-like protein